MTPTGTWGTDLFWSADPLGAAATGAWVPAETAVFSAGTDAVGPFTVTLNGTQAVSGINFEEGSVVFAGTGAAALGSTGIVNIGPGTSLSIDTAARLTGSAGSKVVLNGGTLINTNPGNAGSFIAAAIGLEIGPGGGTINYTSSGAGAVTIYGGAAAGTITGTGTLTKTGPQEFRYQGVGLPNTTFTKLVVAEGLYRLGFNSSISDERGFGAVPAAFTPDAITLMGGGSIGTSFAAANSVLHANRGITLGVGGGSINGSMTIPGAITGAGSLSHLTTGTLNLNGNSDYTGPTIVTTGIVTVGNANALGSPAGNTQVSNVGEIRFDGAAINFTVAEPFQIAGPGGGGGGAITIQNSSSPTLSGPITLTGDATVTVSSTSTGTFTNPAAFTSQSNQSLTLQGGAGAGGGGTVTGAIALGTGGLTKAQGGTWTLAGPSTYSGVTTVSAGTLDVTGSITGTSQVAVSGTLAGTGTVTLATTGDLDLLAGGRLSPGANGIGNLTVTVSGGGAVDLVAGVTPANSQALVFTLDTPAASDKITLTGGSLNIGTGVLEFDDFAFTPGGGFGVGDYLLFDGNSPITGTLGPVFSGAIGALTGELQLANGGTDVVLHVVPEPGSTTLLAATLGLVLSRRRRK